MCVCCLAIPSHFVLSAPMLEHKVRLSLAATFAKKKKILTQVVCFTNFRKKQNKHSYNFFSLPDHIISLLIPSFNPVQTLKSHNMMRGRSRPGRLWMLFAADFAGQFTAVQNCYHVIHAKAYLLDCLKFYTSQPALASS